MADDGQNYSIFNSRLLVDVVGDVTDEALKASRLKEIIGVIGGRLFNWASRTFYILKHCAMCKH